jgi:hypothetical protein
MIFSSVPSPAVFQGSSLLAWLQPRLSHSLLATTVERSTAASFGCAVGLDVARQLFGRGGCCRISRLSFSGRPEGALPISSDEFAIKAGEHTSDFAIRVPMCPSIMFEGPEDRFPLHSAVCGGFMKLRPVAG